MKTFSEYWKEKAQKRRKSWAAKAKRFAEQHTQLEDIRKEVYLPLDFGVTFSFEDYKPEHFVKLNPITSWQDKNFCFSEDGLRSALKAEGADMNSFFNHCRSFGNDAHSVFDSIFCHSSMRFASTSRGSIDCFQFRAFKAQI